MIGNAAEKINDHESRLKVQEYRLDSLEAALQTGLSNVEKRIGELTEVMLGIKGVAKFMAAIVVLIGAVAGLIKIIEFIK
jgi:hypothetical protein